MKEIVARLKFVRLRDYFAGVQFIFALPFAYILKFKRPHIWLVCEDKNEARDNGYYFFKYLREKQVQIDAVYAINKKSPDFLKVKDLGEVISYGSFTHWIYYLAAKYNISSQKSGKPNAAICYFLEVYGIWHNKRVFLQHGVTINNCKWLHYNVTKMSCFICGAKPEYEYVRDNFGYPKGSVKYTGLARYDNLHESIVVKNRILIMPTWREWLQKNVVRDYVGNTENAEDFCHSEYFLRWNELLQDDDFNDYIKANKLEVIFYPHRNMQPYLNKFTTKNNCIKIASWKEYDVQDLLKSSQLLITDYSSVFFDFAYMKKPVIFYQFDECKYRKFQYEKGWFDYSNNPIGIKVTEINKLIDALKKTVDEIGKVNYENDIIFPLHDTSNCKRIYDAIKENDYM